MPQESTAIELSSSLSTNVFRFFFFFDRARRHPLALARAPTSTVSKGKILPLGQLVNIFSSLSYDYMIVALSLKVRVSC